MRSTLRQMAVAAAATLLVAGCSTAEDEPSSEGTTVGATPTGATTEEEAATETEPKATKAPRPERSEKERPTAEPTSAPAEEEPVASMGEAARDGDAEFVVRKRDTGVSSLSDGYTTITPQGQFVVVHLEVANIGNEALVLLADDQRLIDDQGRKHSADMEAEYMWPDSVNVFYTSINPGLSLEGAVVFDMPAAAEPHAIELHDSFPSDGVTVSLVE